MSEDAFWDEIRRNIGKQGHFDRIESGYTSPGIPDVGYCIQGSGGLLELKYMDKKSRPKIRPSQVTWFRKRVRHGGHPLLLLKDMRFGRDYFLFYGHKVPELAAVKPHDWPMMADKRWHGSMHWEGLIRELVKAGGGA